uniref:Mei2-like C-terminal RNA recognition motif domain-containing protein n=1 Tax=Globisporangium ultimum (strain ATCC 200006 / CBS 805.95 / DAOM BR144) TaxID=431595 RepID=K3X4L6_GLOUD
MITTTASAPLRDEKPEGVSHRLHPDALSLKAAMIRDGEATDTLVDPDQEIAPGSPIILKDNEAESYDLWSNWSVRSFSERSSSIDSTSQWRNLRSLSIDSKASSATNAGDDDLPLQSISKSLQSLAFASPQEEKHMVAEPPSSNLFASRPRSFSDYSSLRSSSSSHSRHSSMGDKNLWHESSAKIGSESARHAMTSPLYPTSCMELWQAMKTNFPSRHLILKNAKGTFDTTDVTRIRDNMNNFGSLAKVRSEFASEGLLFFTFFELKCAIGAAKHWQSSNFASVAEPSPQRQPSPAFSPPVSSIRSSFPNYTGETIHFCLPYELPDDVNCATLLVQLHGPPMSSNEMRQFSSRYGEVASVLQNDINSSKYIVEYNDARDIDEAIRGLTSSFHASGPITAARTSPPTLDMAKIQLFQERLDTLSVLVAPHLMDLETRARTSFSSSTASLLTSSPTSTPSSPLNGSLLETSADGNGIELSLDVATASRTTSPFDGGLYQIRKSSPSIVNSEDSTIWSGRAAASSSLRPRSSSSSLISIGSSGSSMTSAAAPNMFADPGHYSNPYNPGMTSSAIESSATVPSYAPSHHLQQQQQHGLHLAPAQHPTGAQFHHQHLQQRIMLASGGMMANKYGGPARSGSDPSFRSSNSGSSSAHFGGSFASNSSNGTVTTGRNDQGVGEFSLSIERVSAGEDTRTTLMIRNIPNKYTQQMLLHEINVHHRGQYDFFYLPIDFKNKCNMGYAFINFMDAASIVPFYQEFDSQKWTNFNSEKVCAISYARLQGKQAMITRFQNSSLLEKHESYRPLVFVSSGMNRGKPEPFPASKQQPSHKKQLHHSHHPHHHMMMTMMGGAGDDFNSAAGRMYTMQTHLQQQQQLQALQHAQYQLMANSHHHMNFSNGMPLASQNSGNLNFHHQQQHGFHAPMQHQHQQEQRHAKTTRPLAFGASSSAANNSTAAPTPGYST